MVLALDGPTPMFTSVMPSDDGAVFSPKSQQSDLDVQTWGVSPKTEIRAEILGFVVCSAKYFIRARHAPRYAATMCTRIGITEHFLEHTIPAVSLAGVHGPLETHVSDEALGNLPLIITVGRVYRV